ncbi:hypothetical protein [Lewinella sp. W8]|uniref:hypothetical protein n=1 Tax=Lewinella sp. W8 TaxID=2528208 RepID=UPI00106884D1|nr:hypothetical protein [Lewinella sp. W8]MTB49997.1 hypothetical protein [Lewinella sp. W8]
MLDSIIDLVKDQALSTITEKAGIDLGQAEKTLPLAQESITDGLMGAVSGGNVDGILDMLKSATGSSAGGGLLNNMVYKGIAGSFVSKATSALGLSEGVASTISSVVLPMIMEKIGGAAQAAGDTNDIDASSVMDALGLDAGSLLGQLGGSGDLLGKAAQMLGDSSSQGKKGGGLLGGLMGMFKK